MTGVEIILTGRKIQTRPKIGLKLGRVDKAEKKVKIFFRVRCFTRLFVGLI